MSIITSPLLLGADGVTQYQVSRSLRFNSGDSAYLSRTPSVAGNRRTWTWSGWLKFSNVTGNYGIFTAPFQSGSNNLTDSFEVWYNAGTIHLTDQATYYFSSAAIFRDPTAWQHFTFACDTTQATASNRFKVYQNGVLLANTASGTITQNLDTAINKTVLQTIGEWRGTYANDYLADVHFVDGQALTPSSFTETNATTGQLIPKAYTGSYGTNGFKLNFSDNSTTAALGTDTSGNGNTWTVNNLSVTAGSGNDSLVDTPTSYGTDTGVGGSVRGNYATLNPLTKGSDVTLSNGNLDYACVNTTNTLAVSSIAMSSGKWYCEFTSQSAGNIFGIYKASLTPNISYLGSDLNGWGYYFGGTTYHNASSSAYGSSFTTNDVIGIAFDADAGSLYFYKNGVIQNSGTPAFTGLSFGPYVFASGTNNGNLAAAFNAGQRAFAYTAPSGFKALCDTNLPTPVVAKPNTVMDAKLYTGNGATQTISGLNFDSDLLWIKRRDGTNSHQLTDTVRGLTKYLFSDATLAEETRADQVTATSSTGFSLGSNAAVNASAGSYVAWAWDAGTSTVTNTAGSITSQVRANASAGFSVVTYTGTGANATVGHGLGVQPQFLIIKCRDTAGDPSWIVSHTSIGLGSGRLILNGTQANSTSGAATLWNSTAPTSSVFSLGDYSSVNGSTLRFVAYCFAPVSGYSSMGSYVGNGSSDGVFVYTGMRPRWLLVKSSSNALNWYILDTARDTYNTISKFLYPNLSDAEVDGGAGVYVDYLSNGFKWRSSASAFNGSGITYIYYAVAESPFQYARAR